MAKNRSERLRPAVAFPVWDYIRDEMRSRKWSLETMAQRMGGNVFKNKCVLNILKHCKNQQGIILGKATAKQLGHAFGTSHELWLNLDKAYRSWRRHSPVTDTKGKT